jgi:hypothetical protein
VRHTHCGPPPREPDAVVDWDLRADRDRVAARRTEKRGTQNQAIGKSRGGLTTKIAVIVDALGNLIRFVLLPGQRHDITSFDALMASIYCLALIGDKGSWLAARTTARQ